MYNDSTSLGSEFNTRVLTEYDRRSAGYFSEAVKLSKSVEPGHPAFVELEVGDKRSIEMSSLFLDLTNFTGRTFWDSPDDVSDLAHAVLSGFTLIVTRFGGHVLGLRGDGLFAGFGPTLSSIPAVAAAAGAAGTALALVRDSLNPALQSRGIEPVQARAGADFGTATFVRTGTEATNEVNVIGFSSNFAAKCEKYAKSWEVVVGERFAKDILNSALLEQHVESPKKYTRDGETKTYRFYDYKWAGAVKFAESTAAELAGKPLELAY